MSTGFGPRRKGKIVSRDDAPDNNDEGPTVKRPSRPKVRASRVSFNPTGTGEAEEDDDGGAAVIKPKRLGLGLGRKSGLATERLPVSHVEDDHRPSYSAESLAELKNAQQARPEIGDLDIANKFGTTLKSYEQRDASSLIPTAAEIQEKKARRARLAKLQQYGIQSGDSDDADDEERHERRDSNEDEFLTQRDRVSLREARDTVKGKKEVETRLVRDDEDLMEGFESFTGEDSRVALGEASKKAERAQRRADMEDMINAAQKESDEDEDGGDDDDDDDRDMRNEYEAIQTRKGMESLQVDNNFHCRHQTDRDGARTPTRITPIPPLSSCVERLRTRLLEMEAERSAKIKRMEELEAEKRDIAQREIDIQKLLRDTAEKYDKLGREAGLSIDLSPNAALNGLLSEAGESVVVDDDRDTMDTS